MTISRGDLWVFVDRRDRWISTLFLSHAVILIGSQIYRALFKTTKPTTVEGMPGVGH
jgi:hypothetical protein